MNDELYCNKETEVKGYPNNIYNTDEILELLKDFEDTDNYAGALSFVCLLLGTAPEKIWTMFEYVE